MKGKKCKFGFIPGECQQYNCCFLNMDGSCSKDGKIDNQTAVLRTFDNNQIVTSQPFYNRLIKKDRTNIQDNESMGGQVMPRGVQR